MWGDRIDARLLGLFGALALHVDDESDQRRIALMMAGLRCQKLLESMTPILQVHYSVSTMCSSRSYCRTAVVPPCRRGCEVDFSASGYRTWRCSSRMMARDFSIGSECGYMSSQ